MHIIEFVPDAEFKTKFKLEKDKYTFDTHQDLDSFVHYLMSVCPTFKLDHDNERVLLKSFDRAFWLRVCRIFVDFCRISKNLMMKSLSLAM